MVTEITISEMCVANSGIQRSKILGRQTKPPAVSGKADIPKAVCGIDTMYFSFSAFMLTRFHLFQIQRM